MLRKEKMPNGKYEFVMPLLDNSTFYECACGGCTVMRLQYDDELEEFYLSMYNDYKAKFSWWWRLRQFYHILKYGVPYEDQLILSKKDAKRLVKDICSKVDCGDD